MYQTLVGVSAIYLRVCAALPVQDEPTSSWKSGQLLGGFPATDLPEAAVLLNPGVNSTSLQLPIIPKDGSVRASIHAYPDIGVPPSLGELVMSIAIEIYWFWREEMDHSIDYESSSRRPPLDGFLYLAQPPRSGSAFLTSSKLALAHCRVLEHIFRSNTWPPYIVANMLEWPGSRNLGMLSIEHTRPSLSSRGSGAALQTTAVYIEALEKSFGANSTLDHLLLEPTPRTTTARTSNLTVMDDRTIERRWFECLSKMLFWMLPFPTFGLVGDRLAPPPSGPGKPTATYHFACYPGPRTPALLRDDRLDVTIYADVRRFNLRLTWLMLVEELLLLGTGVALGYGWDTKGLVMDGDVALAAVQIRIGEGPRGGLGED